jgi:hypothetical protein
MKQLIIFTSFTLFVIIASCSKVDDYSAPDSGIYGQIIDSTTNEAIQTEMPNGIKMCLYQTSFKTPVVISTWIKADGTFENDNLFGDAYKVIPTEGAFVKPDTQVVKIYGRTEVNFTVMPFLTVNASVTTASNKVIVNYTISRSVVTGSIVLCETLCSRVPNVSSTIYEYYVSHDLSSTAASQILSKQFTDTISGLTSGATYYVRAAARTNNTNKKFNYSPVFKVTIP